jgi:hypothetical protein
MNYYYAKCLECNKSTSNSCPAHSSCSTTYSTIQQPHKCPCCSGTGKVSRPPWIAGDIQEWVSSGTELYSCQPCNGKGILWR